MSEQAAILLKARAFDIIEKRGKLEQEAQGLNTELAQIIKEIKDTKRGFEDDGHNDNSRRSRQNK